MEAVELMENCFSLIFACSGAWFIALYPLCRGVCQGPTSCTFVLVVIGTSSNAYVAYVYWGHGAEGRSCGFGQEVRQDGWDDLEGSANTVYDCIVRILPHFACVLVFTCAACATLLTLKESTRNMASSSRDKTVHTSGKGSA